MRKHQRLLGTAALSLMIGVAFGSGTPSYAAGRSPDVYRTDAGIGASASNAGLSVTDFGAVANDGRDDYAAFAAAATAAKQQRKTLHVPAGTFTLGRVLTIDSIRMEGAGKDSTVLVSTDPRKGSIRAATLQKASGVSGRRLLR